MACWPSASAVVVHVATPVVSSGTAEQIAVAPSKKVTGPLRDVSALETVAVKITDEPRRLGLLFEVRVMVVGSTVSTCPERLMTFGLLPALLGCVTEPRTGLPITVGANSTP